MERVGHKDFSEDINYSQVFIIWKMRKKIIWKIRKDNKENHKRSEMYVLPDAAIIEKLKNRKIEYADWACIQSHNNIKQFRIVKKIRKQLYFLKKYRILDDEKIVIA